MKAKKWKVGAVLLLSLCTAFQNVTILAAETTYTSTIADTGEAGVITVTNTIDLSTYEGTELVITSDTILTGTAKSTLKTITVSGTGITVTLDNVTMTGRGQQLTGSQNPYAGIEIIGDVTLNLQGSNTISSEVGAGIRVLAGNSLTIEGSGSLTATGGSESAAIGSDKSEQHQTYGNITINSGTIIATGGSNSAGIGGGYMHEVRDGKSQGIIEINGGNITATGTSGGAGIGGGKEAKTDNVIIIRITGGTINATGTDGGAGIGGGANGKDVKEISISGGDITAISTGSGDGGAGIGGGNERGVKEINISGDAYIRLAQGGNGGAGIGSGAKGNTSVGETINITGGIIEKAQGGGTGAGIGGGEHRACIINISGDALIKNALGGDGGGAGIGGGSTCSTNNESSKINITGGKVQNAVGGPDACGIGGGGGQGAVGDITISNAVIENAQGTGEGAGIGSSKEGQGGNIFITNGARVCATSGQDDVNDIGGGEGRTTSVKVKVDNGAEIYTGHGNVAALTADSECYYYVFQLYEEYDTRTVFTGSISNLEMYSKLSAGDEKKISGFDISNFTYDKTYSKTETIDGVSTTYTVQEVHTFLPSNNPNAIFSGFWMQYGYDDNSTGTTVHKLKIANPVFKKDGAGNLISPKQVIYEYSDATKRILAVKDNNGNDIEKQAYVVPLQFIESTEPIVEVGEIDDKKAGIIPYSVSNYKFELPALCEAGSDSVDDTEITVDNVTLTIDMQVGSSYDVDYILSEMALEVYKKDASGNYVKNEDLTTKVKNAISSGECVDNGGDQYIKFEYPEEMRQLPQGELILKLYIPTNYLMGIQPTINEYNSTYVKHGTTGGQTSPVKVTAVINYTLKTEKPIYMSDSGEVEYMVENKTETKTQTLDIDFNEFDKVY